LCHHVLPGRDTAEGFVGSLFVVAGDPIDRHATDRTEGFKGGSRFKCRKCVIQLLQDQNIDPDDISLAGWFVALRDPLWKRASKYEDFASLAAYLENDELCRILLRGSPVHLRPVEYLLTQVRRWLLVSTAWRRYPQLTDALGAQAALNGGAWPFDGTERALLNDEAELTIVRRISRFEMPH
jgi:hypothetical protein